MWNSNWVKGGGEEGVSAHITTHEDGCWRRHGCVRFYIRNYPISHWRKVRTDRGPTSFSSNFYVCSTKLPSEFSVIWAVMSLAWFLRGHRNKSWFFRPLRHVKDDIALSTSASAMATTNALAPLLEDRNMGQVLVVIIAVLVFFTVVTTVLRLWAREKCNLLGWVSMCLELHAKECISDLWFWWYRMTIPLPSAAFSPLHVRSSNSSLFITEMGVTNSMSHWRTINTSTSSVILRRYSCLSISAYLNAQYASLYCESRGRRSWNGSCIPWWQDLS